MPSASGGLVCAAAATTTMIEADGPLYRKRHGTRQIHKTAHDRRQLQSATDAILDTRDLCARARLVVHESQELLQQIDDLYRSTTGSVLRKNKYVVDP